MAAVRPPAYSGSSHGLGVLKALDKADIRSYCDSNFTCAPAARCEDSLVCDMGGSLASGDAEKLMLILSFITASVVVVFSAWTISSQMKLPDSSPGKSKNLLYFSIAMLIISVVVVILNIVYIARRIKK